MYLQKETLKKKETYLYLATYYIRLICWNLAFCFLKASSISKGLLSFLYYCTSYNLLYNRCYVTLSCNSATYIWKTVGILFVICDELFRTLFHQFRNSVMSVLVLFSDLIGSKTQQKIVRFWNLELVKPHVVVHMCTSR